MKQTIGLGDRRFWRQTFRLALPIALQNVLTSSFQIVDTMMVSRLGDVVLSAVGMAGQCNWLIGLLNFGLASGLSIFVAQYWGVKDKDGIRRSYGVALVSSMTLAFLYALLLFCAPGFCVSLFGPEADAAAEAVKYLRILAFGVPFMM